MPYKAYNFLGYKLDKTVKTTISALQNQPNVLKSKKYIHETAEFQVRIA
jgi:hypothetical protein